ncbi:tonB-system energizer ExbB, partial [Sinorhizobium meliloti CCNWSX0020]
MSDRIRPKLNVLLAATLAVFLAGPVANGLAQTVQQPSSVSVDAQPPATDVPGADDPGAQPAPLEAAAGDATAGDATEVNPVLPHDLSPVGMFLAADIVVKAVMVALALASVATWAIFLVKTLELIYAKSRLKRAVAALVSANGLAEVQPKLERRAGVAGEMVAAAIDEMTRSEAVLDLAPAVGVKERVSSLLTRIEVRAGK